MTGGQDEEEQGPLVTANGTLEELGSLPFSSSAAASTGYSSVLWDPSDAKRVVGLGVNGSSFGVFSVATSEFATTSVIIINVKWALK